MRWTSASTSFADGTPSLPSDFETRSSKIDSSLSHCWPALAVTSPAMLLILLVTSPIFSSATACVLRCSDAPSFTSASNTLPPSSCAFENAPRPASQICCADSFTVPASALSNRRAAEVAFLSAICLSFLTMMRVLCVRARLRSAAADGNYRTACRGEHPISLVRRLYALGETAQGRALCSDKNQRLAANTPSKEERMQYFVTGATGFIGKR